MLFELTLSTCTFLNPLKARLGNGGLRFSLVCKGDQYGTMSKEKVIELAPGAQGDLDQLHETVHKVVAMTTLIRVGIRKTAFLTNL